LDNDNLNIEKLKEILEPYMNHSPIPDSIQNLIKNRLSNINDTYPREMLLKFKDYWDADVLIKNKNIHWDFQLFTLLKEKQLIELIEENNIDLMSLLYWFRTKNISLNLYQRRKLSSRTDISLEHIREYPTLFEFGKGIEMTSVFIRKGSRGEYELISNLCTNPNVSFDWKFVHDFKDEIDFWYWSRYGKISIEIIKDFSSCFDVYRPYEYRNSRHSDYGNYDHYQFSSAWENLFGNPNIDIDELVRELGDRYFRKIDELDGFEATSKYELTESDLIHYLKNVRKDENAKWFKIKEIAARSRY